MSQFVRITVYRVPTGLALHVEHMLGAMPRPKVLRRREKRLTAIQGVAGWPAALEWAGKELLAEARRLRTDPTSVGGAPHGGPRGASGSTLNLDLNA